MTRALCAVLTLLLAGCPAPSGEPDEPTPAPAVDDEGPGPLAAGVSIRRVAINQASEAAIERFGELVEDPPLRPIAGREGLIRVYLNLDDGFEERRLLGVLTLVQPDGFSVTYTVDESIRGPSLEEDLDTTVDFALPAADLEVGTRLLVEIRELTGDPDAQGPDTARWPEDGVPQDILVSDWGGVLRVAIVPVKYTFDGTDRMPDTSPEQLALLESWLLRLYPVREVQLTVLEEYATELELNGSSDRMSDLLAEIRDLRQERGVPFDTYTYGMVKPAEELSTYCAGGCTLGIAYRVGNPNTHWLRSGVGMGYSGERTALTMAHEVGHNHDRGHAPCGGAGNTDPDFPSSTGGIVTWGFDIVERTLVDPEQTADFMGYCDPQFVGAYQFAALQTRLNQVEGLSGIFDRSPEEWLFVELRSSGGRSTGLRTLNVPPDGEPTAIRWVGAEQADDVGYFHDIADAPGAGTLVTPPPPPGATAVVVGERTIAL